MSKLNQLAELSVDIKPQETILFSTAARNPKFKDFITHRIKDVKMTPAARRIYSLIVGINDPLATSAERQMAWQFAQAQPESSRLMKESFLLLPKTRKIARTVQSPNSLTEK